MITFSTINKNVQKTLFERMSMLERDSSVSTVGGVVDYPIGEPTTEEKGEPNQNYMFTRSTFMRMISLTPPVIGHGSKGKPIVLMGGEATLRDGQYGITHSLTGAKGSELHPETIEITDNWVEKQGAAPVNPETNMDWSWPTTWPSNWNTHFVNEPVSTVTQEAFTEQTINPGKYWTEGEAQPYRPMPGVKDVSVEYKGGGMTLGATREATINWTCWTWADLDRMMPHFLHHGKTIFIDWGWSGIGNLKDVELYNDLFNENGNFNTGVEFDHISELQKHINRQNGNYDGMIGIVKNFEWQVRDDGGFDCTTNIISTGVNILQQKLKTSSDSRLNALPMLIKNENNINRQNKNKFWPDRKAPIKKLFTDEKIIIFPKLSIEIISPVVQVISTSEQTVLKAKSGQSAVAKYAPYINFDIYLDDLDNQLGSLLKNNESVMKSGHIIKISSSYTVSKETLKKSGFSGEEEISTKDYDISISGTYVTWGWFEDNVLSRFFSKKVDSGTGIFGVIRSIEDIGEGIVDEQTGKPIDVSGEFEGLENQNLLLFRLNPELQGTIKEVRKEAWDNYKEKSTSTKRSVLIRNHPEMMMTDSSKFIIVNHSNDNKFIDPGKKFIEDGWSNWGKGKPRRMIHHKWKYDLPNSNIEHWYQIRGNGGKDVQPRDNNLLYKFNPFNKNGGIEIHEFRDEKKVDQGILRNVYFNVKFLQEKMKGQSSIEKAILNVWNGFSDEYGGIYKFKLEFSDDGNRIMVKDDGWTLNSVKSLIENKSQKLNPDTEDGSPDSTDNFEGLFEFPTWEKSSVVKSQNLSAKLPNRMQVAAMYGSQNKSKGEDIKEEEETQTWDDRTSMAWGRLTAPLDEKLSSSQGLTREQYSQKVLDDVIGKGYDFPWKNNRRFGSSIADISKPLAVDKDDGTIIYSSIIDKLMTHHHEIYIAKNKAIIEQLKLEKEKKIEDDKIAETARELDRRLNKKQKSYDNIISGTGGILDLFTFKDKDYETLFLDPVFKSFMIKSIKNSKSGIPTKSDPIIPIEFDIDVDGIAGIYPGNAFQSSYLPTRYKQMACFQAIGVNQQIDSSGWTSTIKGQIRVSIENQINEDKFDKEELFEETKEWVAPDPPPRPKIPIPSDTEDMLGDMELEELKLETFEEWEPLPPYIESPPSPDAEMLGDLEIDEMPFPDDFEEWEPLGGLDNNLQPQENNTIFSNVWENPFGIEHFQYNQESWRPIIENIEGVFSDPIFNVDINVNDEGSMLSIFIREFGMESDKIDEGVAYIIQTLNQYTGGDRASTVIGNQLMAQITSDLTNQNNPGTQISIGLLGTFNTGP